MLTAEQTKARTRDAEILRLKKENERLQQKCFVMAQGFCELFDSVIAPEMSPHLRSQLVSMVDELRDMKKEDF